MKMAIFSWRWRRSEENAMAKAKMAESENKMAYGAAG